MTDTCPQYLYRYRHLQGRHRESTKRIITHSILHFAAPTAFNDPFDCKIHYRPHLALADLRRRYTNLVKKYEPELNRAQRRTRAAQDTSVIDPIEFLTTVSVLFSARGGWAWSALVIRNLPKHLALVALCGWTYRTLLEVSSKGRHPLLRCAQPVAYLADYPEVDCIRDSPIQHVKAFLLTKAADWKYEEEWRIIDHDAGSGDHVFPEELLVGVVLGARMTDKDRSDVVDWVHDRGHPIEIYDASVNRGSYSLDIKKRVT